MEEYFKTQINYNSSNFYNDYIDKYDRKILDLVYAEPNKQKNTNIILNTLEIFFNQTNEPMKKIDLIKDELIDNGFKLIAKRLIGELEGEYVQKEQIDKINHIIGLILMQRHSSFKFNSFSELFRRIQNENIFKKYSQSQLADLVGKMKIELNLPNFTVDQVNDSDDIRHVNNLNNEMRNIWRFRIEDFFDRFSEDEFKNNIELFQDFYELVDFILFKLKNIFFM